MQQRQLSEAEVESVLEWCDSVPLSRPKRNVARDFSDGVMAAEVVHHHLPRLVELHNYSGSNGTAQKKATWQTLQRKVLSRLGVALPQDLLDAVVTAKPGAAEFVLFQLRAAIRDFQAAETHRKQQKQLQPVPSPQRRQQQQQHHHLPAAASSSEDFLVEEHQRPAAETAVPTATDGGSGSGALDQLALVLQKKDEAIAELVAQVSTLQRRVATLEELVRVKDEKIAKLQQQQHPQW